MLTRLLPEQNAVLDCAAVSTVAANSDSSAVCHNAGAAADAAEIDALDERPSPQHEGRRSHVPYVDDDPAEAAMAAVGRYMDAVVKVPTASSAVLTPHSITCISTVCDAHLERWTKSTSCLQLRC